MKYLDIKLNNTDIELLLDEDDHISSALFFSEDLDCDIEIKWENMPPLLKLRLQNAFERLRLNRESKDRNWIVNAMRGED